MQLICEKFKVKIMLTLVISDPYIQDFFLPSSHLNNRCICPLGYTGTFCELDANNCIGNQCSEYGFCQYHLHNYSCICVPGYEGAFCEVEINECSSSPCRNGATCMDLIDHFSCQCAAGFKGKFPLLKWLVLQMWLSSYV